MINPAYGQRANTEEMESMIDQAVGGKQNTINGAASTITSSNLISNRVVTSSSSGKITYSGITSNELNALNNISGNVQTRLGEIETSLSSGSDVLTSYLVYPTSNPWWAFYDNLFINNFNINIGSSGFSFENDSGFAMNILYTAFTASSTSNNTSVTPSVKMKRFTVANGAEVASGFAPSANAVQKIFFEISPVTGSEFNPISIEFTCTYRDASNNSVFMIARQYN